MKEIAYEGEEFKKEEGEWETKKPMRSIGSEKVHPLRTYRADVEEMMVESKLTTVDIIEAETKRREDRGEKRLIHDEPEESHLGRMIFALLLLFALGLGIGAYALFGGIPKNLLSGLGGEMSFGLDTLIDTKKDTKSDTETSEPAIILITDSPREQILADISIAFGGTKLSPEMFRDVRFEEGGETKRPASVSEFLSSAALFTPSGLAQSFGATFLYRIYVLDRSSGYMILPVRSYPDAFSGMLSWEPRTPTGLVPLLSPWVDRKGLAQLELSPSMRFSDIRIGGVDARMLKDASGSELLVYGFPTKDTLIIAATSDGFRHATGHMTPAE